jgi:ankyrin repeat protein
MVSTTLPRGGWTALMYAARQNAADAARALADSGAALNLADPDGTTALVFAIINAHFDLAAALLDRGADPNIADETGMAALYAAVDMHTLGPMISRPAPKLADELDAAGLVKLLLKHGADPNARLKRPVLGRHHDGGDASLAEGTTALMRAVKTNDIAVIQMLLDAGANPHLTQKDYTNALMIAAAGGARAGAYAAAFNVTEAGTIEVMKLLLDRGLDINAFNANGLTALHRAAARGADQVVRFLAENGAKLDQRDRQGRTPVDMALEVQRVAGGTPLRPKEGTAALLRSLAAAQAK